MRLLHLGSMKESPSSLAQRILCGPYFPLLISNGIRFPFPRAKTQDPMTPSPLVSPVKHRYFFFPTWPLPDDSSRLRGKNLWPGRGLGHAAANILFAHMLVKFSLMHSHRRLFPRPAKSELSSGFVHAVGKVLQCLQARRIDGGHIAQRSR